MHFVAKSCVHSRISVKSPRIFRDTKHLTGGTFPTKLYQKLRSLIFDYDNTEEIVDYNRTYVTLEIHIFGDSMKTRGKILLGRSIKRIFNTTLSPFFLYDFMKLWQILVKWHFIFYPYNISGL